jgi:hypothetical protein
MAATGHHRQPFRAEPLPPDLLGQGEEDIDRRVDRPG